MLRTSSVAQCPTEPNMVVAVDLEQYEDCLRNKHTYLNMIEIATKLSVFKWIRNKESSTAADAIQHSWVGPFGPPLVILHDQGGKFNSAFTLMAKRYCGMRRATSTESPWQKQVCERHGAVRTIGRTRRCATCWRLCF